MDWSHELWVAGDTNQKQEVRYLTVGLASSLISNQFTLFHAFGQVEHFMEGNCQNKTPANAEMKLPLVECRNLCKQTLPRNESYHLSQ